MGTLSGNVEETLLLAPVAVTFTLLLLLLLIAVAVACEDYHLINTVAFERLKLVILLYCCQLCQCSELLELLIHTITGQIDAVNGSVFGLDTAP